jgi:hypothetical protein
MSSPIISSGKGPVNARLACNVRNSLDYVDNAVADLFILFIETESEPSPACFRLTKVN